jgi:hypothetical protein
MKLSAILAAATAMLLTSVVHAQDKAIEACISSLAASNFAGQKVTYRIEGNLSLLVPLALRSDAPITAVATNKTTGRRLAVASCDGKGAILNVTGTKPRITVAAR